MSLRRWSLALLAAVPLVTLPALATPAGAATFTVTTTADGGPGSLRQAVLDANAAGGANTIVLAADETYELTDCGAGALTSTAGPLTIEGHAAIVRQTCAARTLVQQSATMLTVDDTNIGGNASGGGIAADGSVTLNKALIVDNHPTGAGGGGVFAGGAITITDSTISQNSITGNGAGVSATSATVTNSILTMNEATGLGGGLFASTTATITGSQIYNNTAFAGAGVYVDVNDLTLNQSSLETNHATGLGGGAVGGEVGTVSVTGGRVVGNHADTFGGGLVVGAQANLVSTQLVDNVSAQGGGGLDTTGVVNLTGTTVSGNLSTAGTGGVRTQGGVVHATNSTVSGNLGGDVGGLFASGVDLHYVTLAGNSGTGAANVGVIDGAMQTVGTVFGAGSVGPSCAFTSAANTSGGYNFEQGSSTCQLTGTADVVNGPDPLLGGLTQSAGTTPTRTPQPGSPLVNMIPPNVSECVNTVDVDQRGIARPQMTNCDIGAVEVRAPAATGSAVSTPVNTPVDVRIVPLVDDPDAWLDGGRLTVVQGPSSGTTDVVGGNTVRYSPNATFVGNDAFDYQVCPPVGSFCVRAPIAVTVNGATALPVNNNGTTTPVTVVPAFTG